MEQMQFGGEKRSKVGGKTCANSQELKGGRGGGQSTRDRWPGPRTKANLKTKTPKTSKKGGHVNTKPTSGEAVPG